MTLTDPFFSIAGRGVSGRDVILIGGGLFLLWKSVHEIHNSLEGVETESQQATAATFGLGGIQDRHYDRHEYMDEKRLALEKWRARLAEIASGSDRKKVGSISRLKRSNAT